MKTKSNAFPKMAAKAAKAGSVLGKDQTRSIMPKILPRWSWHYRTLLALRDRLLRRESALRGAVAEPLESHSMSEADSATDAFDHDLGLSELSAEQDALYEVDQALRRILEGTYGRCEETGKAIAVARLRTIPWARFTREVEERRERLGLGRRPHLGAVKSVRELTREVWHTSEEERPATVPVPGERSAPRPKKPAPDRLPPAPAASMKGRKS